MKIDSNTDFLDGGKNSCKNAIVLKDSASNLYQGTNKHVALFLLYTSCEELEKAIFCLFVHYGHLNKSQINSVFGLHKLKIILFEKIFNDKAIELKNVEFVLNGKPLKSIDLKKLAQQNDALWQKYKQEREGCLYVEPQGRNWHYPKSIANIEKKWDDVSTKWLGLYAFYTVLEKNELDGDLGNFSLVVKRPAGQSKSLSLTFSGSGKAVSRT